MFNNSYKEEQKWFHPTEVMKLHPMKLKKKALQERIKGNSKLSKSMECSDKTSVLEDIASAKKRKNPFVIERQGDQKSKWSKVPDNEESTDQTLFNLLHDSVSKENSLSTNPALDIVNHVDSANKVEIVKAQNEKWLPVDWSLKSKVRLLSEKPFPWNNKLKISEETSGLISFTRCLFTDTKTTLDTSANAKFHQCCLYWQQPSLPWLSLFPRTVSKSSLSVMTSEMKRSLHTAWTDSLRSLFQLLRTRQCPYFYVHANSFTVLFRAAGIGGFSEMHAMISPTTRGFRTSLKQEEVEFSMPLKRRKISESECDSQDSGISESKDEEASNDATEEMPDEDWLKSMGINEDYIKQINYVQEKRTHKTECQVDNRDESLVLIEGVEVHPFYNFLINCKSCVAISGSLAGIPPTLLAPVAFNGATLQTLKVRPSKVHVDNTDYYSVELQGPILPTLIHNLFTISPPEYSICVSYINLHSTIPFTLVNVSHSQIKDNTSEGSVVFGKENLSDCGLNAKVLKYFCSSDINSTSYVECIKYNCENQTFTWI